MLHRFKCIVWWQRTVLILQLVSSSHIYFEAVVQDVVPTAASQYPHFPPVSHRQLPVRLVWASSPRRHLKQLHASWTRRVVIRGIQFLLLTINLPLISQTPPLFQPTYGKKVQQHTMCTCPLHSYIICSSTVPMFTVNTEWWMSLTLLLGETCHVTLGYALTTYSIFTSSYNSVEKADVKHWPISYQIYNFMVMLNTSHMKIW